MTQGTGQKKRVTLSVTNFGPIASAKVDLRPLTVFIGPSNTGKSYLATLAYALSLHLTEKLPGRRTDVSLLESPEVWASLSDDEVRAFGEWLGECAMMSAGDQSEVPPLPATLQKSMRHALCAHGTDGSHFDSLLADCFGLRDTARLKKNGSRGKAQVRVSQFGDSKKPEVVFDARIGNARTSTDVRATSRLEVLPRPSLDIRRLLGSVAGMNIDGEISLSENSRKVMRRVFAELYTRLAPPFAPLACTPHYLPSDRTGVVHSLDLVVGSLIRRATPSWSPSGVPKPMMSGVLGDFFFKMTTMNGREGDFGKLSALIEKGILDGAINIRRDSGTNYPRFFYLPARWDEKDRLPLMNTSSMISELAPVVLYLRNVVKRGDLLIIEEPESHLHPAVQAELAVYLARLVRDGVTVIVTTHSEWLLEQLGNLVRLSGLTPDQREEIESAHPSVAGAALDKEQLGAWLFERQSRSKGSVVREIRLDEESRVLPDQFTDVTVRLYEEWRKITSHLGFKDS